MAIKRPKPEEIVVKLRQVEVLMGQGMPRIDAIRQIGVTEQTYYRWKKKYGGMGTEQLKELKRLQNWSRLSKRSGGSFVRRSNDRLRRAVSDLRWTNSSYRKPRKNASLGIATQCTPGSGTMETDFEEPNLAGKLLLAWRPRSSERNLRRSPQPPSLPREHQQRHARRRILRALQGYLEAKGKDQTKDTRNAKLESNTARRITNRLDEPSSFVV